MKMKSLLPFAATSIAFFVIGFLGSLGIHWSIRPTVEDTPAVSPSSLIELPIATDDLATLNNKNTALKNKVAQLEVKLGKAEIEHDMDEGHARALILELQSYRDERDKLFADLEQRKQKLVNKIEELDTKIEAQIALRDESDQQDNQYDIANELVSLLSYPHPLNDQAAINAALIEHPKTNAEFVEQRFELMLEQEHYKATEALYAALLPVVTALNKEHGDNTTLEYIHCSTHHCEIQTSLAQVKPYFDYWQQWLTQARTTAETKMITHQFAVEDQGMIHGSIIVKRLK